VSVFIKALGIRSNESSVDDWSRNHYYLKIDMELLKHLRRKSVQVIVTVLVLSFFLTSCHGSTDNNFVVVRVFRDANSDFSRELDRKLYGFNNHHRVSSGKVIVVATMEGDYQHELAEKIALVKPQMIILDSPTDAKLVGGMQFEQRAKSVCGRNRDCPAFIPPWVSGEELDATTTLFSAITQE
jgi:hypothetical protein